MGSYLLLLSVLLSWNRSWRKPRLVFLSSTCRYACCSRARSKHQKYRSIINHLLLLIHASTIYVPRSGLIFSPERRVRRARQDRRSFISWGLAHLWNWHSRSFSACEMAISGQLSAKLEEFIYLQSSRSKPIVSVFELWQDATDGPERDFLNGNVEMVWTDWLVTQLSQYFTG